MIALGAVVACSKAESLDALIKRHGPLVEATRL
jgi:hypothetical protein